MKVQGGKNWRGLEEGMEMISLSQVWHYQKVVCIYKISGLVWEYLACKLFICLYIYYIFIIHIIYLYLSIYLPVCYCYLLWFYTKSHCTAQAVLPHSSADIIIYILPAIQLQCACFSGSLMAMITSMCDFDLFTVIVHVLRYVVCGVVWHAFHDTCGDQRTT